MSIQSQNNKNSLHEFVLLVSNIKNSDIIRISWYSKVQITRWAKEITQKQ